MGFAHMRGQQTHWPVQYRSYSENLKDSSLLVVSLRPLGAGAGSPSGFFFFFKRASVALVVDSKGFHDT